MRRVLLVLGPMLAAVLVVFLVQYWKAPLALKVHPGQTIPDLELPDFTGQGRVRLSWLRESPVMIVVFEAGQPDTVPYLRLVERMRALYYERHLVVVGISTDMDKDVVDGMMRKEQISFYILRDPGGLVVRTALGSPTLPTPDTILVAPGGRVVEALSEPVDWRDPRERQRIEAILPPPSQGPTPTPTPKPVTQP
jgi:peroxiredoxin